MTTREKVTTVLRDLEQDIFANVAELCRKHDLPRGSFYCAVLRKPHSATWDKLRKRRGSNPQLARRGWV